ncbi:MAG: 50S ribosomal protein L21 [Candidatus Parcubacteria bacterium]|nr:MAG: 50S ribosomal protein L21 [Candidatus Parcubacteria bacterium]
MIAIIETGGKQYLIKEGSIITTNKIEGEEIIFDKVLLFYDDKKLLIGKPYLNSIYVKGRILKQIKNKIHVIKFKPKTRYKKKIGYKNYFSQIRIEEINFS